jgi:hypothetical protein
MPDPLVPRRDGRSLRELFEAELALHGIAWCRGGCGRYHSHDNGSAFATVATRTVHYNREIATRATLQIGLHEIAHVILNHGPGKGKRAYQREAEAEAWSFQRMRELGVPVPRKSRAQAKLYVTRKKRLGDRIRAARMTRSRDVPPDDRERP